MDRRAELLAVSVAALAGAVAMTWPLPLHALTHLPGHPGAEVADHVWALWAAAQSGSLVVDAPLVDHPRGYPWVVADPLHLLVFVPVLSLGPPAAFAAVHLADLVVAGLGAAALWRWVLRGSARGAVFAALVTPTLPVLAEGLFTGMVEAQTLGHVGLAAALVWRAAERGGRWTAGAGVGLAGCVYAGAYTGLYAAIVAPVFAVGVVLQAPAEARRVSVQRLAIVALVAGVLSLPMIHAVLVLRPALRAIDPTLPGSGSLAAVVFAEPDLPTNKMLSGDLLGLVWPGATSGVFEPGDPRAVAAQHVSYLGAVLVGLSLVGAVHHRRDPRTRTLVAAAAVMGVLGLGYHLQLGGSVVRLADRPVRMPAGLLSWLVPPVGAAARWYRAHVVLGVLVVPLAALGLEHLARRWSLPAARVVAAGALLVAGDTLGTQALAWPRPLFDGTPPAALRTLPGTAPLFQLPLPRGGRATHTLRNPSLLWQAWHGHPIAGNPLVSHDDGTHRDVRRLDRWLVEAVRRHDPKGARTAADGAAALGFEWLVYLPADDPVHLSPDALRAALGSPSIDRADGMAWPLPLPPPSP